MIIYLFLYNHPYQSALSKPCLYPWGPNHHWLNSKWREGIHICMMIQINILIVYLYPKFLSFWICWKLMERKWFRPQLCISVLFTIHSRTHIVCLWCRTGWGYTTWWVCCSWCIGCFSQPTFRQWLKDKMKWGNSCCIETLHRRCWNKYNVLTTSVLVIYIYISFTSCFSITLRSKMYCTNFGLVSWHPILSFYYLEYSNLIVTRISHLLIKK